MHTYEFEISETSQSRGYMTIEAANIGEAWDLMQAKIDKHDLDEINWNYSNNVVPCKIESIECWDDSEGGLAGPSPREATIDNED